VYVRRGKRKQKELDSRTIDHFTRGSIDGCVSIISKTNSPLFSFEEGSEYHFVSEDTGNAFLNAVVFVCPCGDKSPVLLVTHNNSFTLDVIKGLSYQNKNTVCGMPISI
ncbi:hypothetical protein KKG48_03205, partial [Patescibacteria group bacterium]|nr:hypothetical protein [Patescibacteria group bacterium]